MVTSLNDSRRSKLYRAERRLEHELGRGLHPLTTPVEIADVQALVDRAAAAMGLGHELVVESHKRGATSATSWSAHGLIKLPVNRDGEWNEWGRQPIVVLHEVAHCLVDYKLPGHGREFVAALRRVLRWYLVEDQGKGVDAEGALARFDELLRSGGCPWDVTNKERTQIRFQLRHAEFVVLYRKDGSHVFFSPRNARHTFDEERDLVIVQEAGRQGDDAPATLIAVDEIRYAVSKRASAS